MTKEIMIDKIKLNNIRYSKYFMIHNLLGFNQTWLKCITFASKFEFYINYILVIGI